MVFCTKEGFKNKLQIDEDPIECLAFSPSEAFRVLAYGTLEGMIHVIDCSTLTLRLSCGKLQTEDDGYIR